MRINEKHRHHGVALAQVIEYNGFTALNPAVERDFGRYQINHDRELYVKYRTKPQKPGPGSGSKTTYRFTISPEETGRYRQSFAKGGRVFLALVCGEVSVIILRQEQLRELLMIPSENQQWVEVTLQHEHSPRVRGSALARDELVVPHNSCPNHLFDDR